MDKRRLGKQLNIARKDRGLTSEKLSELCNINATYLRQIEGGVKVPSLPVFVSLCTQLQVSPSFLLPEVMEGIHMDTEDELQALWRAASPSQQQLIVAMVKSALETLSAQKKTRGRLTRPVDRNKTE